jgi:hypothetical protein
VDVKYSIATLANLGVCMDKCKRCGAGAVFPPRKCPKTDMHICWRGTNISARMLLRVHRDVHECQYCSAIFYCPRQYKYCSHDCAFEDTIPLPLWPPLPSPPVVGIDESALVCSNGLNNNSSSSSSVNATGPSYSSVASGSLIGTQQPLVPVSGQQTLDINHTIAEIEDAMAIQSLLTPIQTSIPVYLDSSAPLYETPVKCDRCEKPIIGQLHLMSNSVTTPLYTPSQHVLASRFVICTACRNEVVYKQHGDNCAHCATAVGHGCTMWHGHVFCNYGCQHAYVVGLLQTGSVD